LDVRFGERIALVGYALVPGDVLRGGDAVRPIL
jgi:hypothetical protein